MMDDTLQVLHVDDDPEFTELVSLFLEREDDRIRVVPATNPTSALDLCENRDIDCVVSDFEMPGMDGLELLTAVRAKWPELPFILFTGKGSESIASDAISAGVTDYLQKQSGNETYTLLTNRIKNAVETYRTEQSLRETKQRFQLLVEESTDAIFIVAPDGTLEYASPVAEQLIGYTPPELIGTNGFEYIHPDDIETVQTEFSTLVSSPEQRVSVRFRYQHASGSSVSVEARGRNLLDHPVVGGIVVYVRQMPPPSWTNECGGEESDPK